MSFPPSNSQDQSSYSNSPTSAARSARTQQSAWGPSNQQQGVRRGLPPIATGLTSSQPRSGTSSPSRNTFSPTISATNIQPGSKQIASRQSSASSSSSLFSPLGPTSQQAPHSRPRTTATGSPHLSSSSGVGASAAQGGSGGFPSTSGGTSRFVRASPSLSLSTTGSPLSSSSGPQSGGPSGQLTSLVITQLNILLSTIKEDKDRTKWEAQAEKIWKVGRMFRCVRQRLISPARRCARYGGLYHIFPATASKQCSTDLFRICAYHRWRLLPTTCE